jgi:H+/Cl- antiporter ClcA
LGVLPPRTALAPAYKKVDATWSNEAEAALPSRLKNAAALLGALVTTVGLCALFGTGFLKGLAWVEHVRATHPWILWCLPIAGLTFTLATERMPEAWQRGTGAVLFSAQRDARVSRAAGPFALLATLWTHLFGGSAGREGTAVQLGASIAETCAQAFRVQHPVLVRVGIAAGFAAVFGTPLAAGAFAFETLGMIARARNKAVSIAVVPLAALGTDALARRLGAIHAHYTVSALALDEPRTWFAALALAASLAFVARGFLLLLRFATLAFSRLPVRMRLLVGGALTVMLGKTLGTTAYNGLGQGEIDVSFTRIVPAGTVLGKTLMTVLTVGSGFVGGEVTPLFFIGSHTGSTLSLLFTFEASSGAALGLACLFALAANAPLTGALLAYELFGAPYAVLAGLICLVGAHLKGPAGLYPNLPGRKPYFWVF